MKYSRNYKRRPVRRLGKHTGNYLLTLTALCFFFVPPLFLSIDLFNAAQSRLGEIFSTRENIPSAANALPGPLPFYKLHQDIVTTTFWVGEPADTSNGFIANTSSSWDENWVNHYGGIDNPSGRRGFLPAAFLPHENPFYAALPYSDLTDEGDRREDAFRCPNFRYLAMAPYSWCKNSWIAIRHGSKTAYAQWEDTGPFQEDDSAYVFDYAPPRNRTDTGAGLDISPAVRDYLGLSDVSKTDWSFSDSRAVPNGPWKNIVTSSTGTHVN